VGHRSLKSAGVTVPKGCPLSRAQYHVIEALSRGLTYEQYALEAGVSASTVRSHIAAAYKRLDVSNRAAAVIKCAEKGWLSNLQLDMGDEPLPAFAPAYLQAFDKYLASRSARDRREMSIALYGLKSETRASFPARLSVREARHEEEPLERLAQTMRRMP
jgi:DNA-binding CsgD family transcriptional regulator